MKVLKAIGLLFALAVVVILIPEERPNGKPS